MGSNKSKKVESKTEKSTATASPSDGNIPSNVKKVLLLYKANLNDKQQLDLVDAFKRAVINEGFPHIDIKYKVNIAEVDSSSIQNLDWLKQINNVILIRLSADITADLEKIISEKQFVDSDGKLHDKILTVSFGKEIPTGWPPSGTQRRTREQKDFAFGFENESILTRKDLKSGNAKKTLSSIVTALIATHKGEA